MSSPIGRDFKRSRSGGGLSFGISREFFVGLGIGLAIAAGIYVWQQRVVQRLSAELENPSRPEPRPAPLESGETKPPTANEETTPEYGFYDMLPKSEVVISESDEPAKTRLPSSPIERPGAYVLHLGAFRNLDDAERLRTKLTRLGVDAVIQRVTIDTDVFHRVRIGPISELDRLNRTRATLSAADIESVLTRVGD